MIQNGGNSRKWWQRYGRYGSVQLILLIIIALMIIIECTSFVCSATSHFIAEPSSNSSNSMVLWRRAKRTIFVSSKECICMRSFHTESTTQIAHSYASIGRLSMEFKGSGSRTLFLYTLHFLACFFLRCHLELWFICLSYLHRCATTISCPFCCCQFSFLIYACSATLNGIGNICILVLMLLCEEEEWESAECLE